MALLDPALWQMGPARRRRRHAGTAGQQLPVLVHFNGQRSAMRKVELARSEGLWQEEEELAREGAVSLWRRYRERYARTLLRACEPQPCLRGPGNMTE